MAFATVTSLETLMIGINFDNKTTNLVERCITHAEDKYIIPPLSKRYDVSSWTVGSVPPAIIAMSEEIAMGLAYKFMSRGSKESLARAEAIIKPVLENIKGIAKGEENLVDTNGSIVPALSTGSDYVKSSTQDYHTVFDLDSPVNWTIDDDQLDDIADERST